MGSPLSKPVNSEPNPLELGSEGFLESFVNKSGLKIRSYFWPAKNAKAVILIIHGHGSYLPFDYLNPVGPPGATKEYAGSWIEEWNQNGYSVCGIDTQSCGRSEGIYGLRCYFNKYQDLVQDLLYFARSVKEGKKPGFGGLPLFGCGHSLGGCLMTSCGHQAPSLFAGAILLAPMLSLEKVSSKPMNKLLLPLSILLNILVPTWALAHVDRNTTFPNIQEDLDHDPFMFHGNSRVRPALEYLKATKELCQHMKQMVFPFIVFHSKNDTMTDSAGSKKLYSESMAKEKMMCNVDHMWHSLTREPGNRHVLKKAIDWTDIRLGSDASLKKI